VEVWQVPTVKLVQEDLVEVKLDPCSAFARKYVDYVLADAKPSSTFCLVRISTSCLARTSTSCLARTSTTKQGRPAMDIYRIVAPAAKVG
jgi:hypothetical protein